MPRKVVWRSHLRWRRTAILIMWALIRVALSVSWRRLDRKGARRRIYNDPNLRVGPRLDAAVGVPHEPDVPRVTTASRIVHLEGFILIARSHEHTIAALVVRHDDLGPRV